MKKGTQLEPGDNFHNHYASLDFEGADSTKNFPRPRLIKSHLRYSVIPKKKEAKYIFVGEEVKETESFVVIASLLGLNYLSSVTTNVSASLPLEGAT